MPLNTSACVQCCSSRHCVLGLCWAIPRSLRHKFDSLDGDSNGDGNGNSNGNGSFSGTSNVSFSKTIPAAAAGRYAAAAFIEQNRNTGLIPSTFFEGVWPPSFCPIPRRLQTSKSPSCKVLGPGICFRVLHAPPLWEPQWLLYVQALTIWSPSWNGLSAWTSPPSIPVSTRPGCATTGRLLAFARMSTHAALLTANQSSGLHNTSREEQDELQ